MWERLTSEVSLHYQLVFKLKLTSRKSTNSFLWDSHSVERSCVALGVKPSDSGIQAQKVCQRKYFKMSNPSIRRWTHQRPISIIIKVVCKGLSNINTYWKAIRSFPLKHKQAVSKHFFFADWSVIFAVSCSVLPPVVERYTIKNLHAESMPAL